MKAGSVDNGFTDEDQRCALEWAIMHARCRAAEAQSPADKRIYERYERALQASRSAIELTAQPDLLALLGTVLQTEKEMQYNGGEWTVNPKWQEAVEQVLVGVVSTIQARTGA